MSRDVPTDYEQKYHLLNSRRNQEYQLLEKVGVMQSELYVSLVQRDRAFAQDMVSWDRRLMAESMVFLSELMDTYRAVDTDLENSAMEPAGTIAGMEAVHGSEEEGTDH